MNVLKKGRKRLLILIDTFIFVCIFGTTLLVSALSSTSVRSGITNMLINAAIFYIFIFIIRFIGKTYSNLWRYAGADIFIQIVICDACGGLIAIVVTHLFSGVYLGVWQSVTFVALFDLATLCSRFLYQIVYRLQNNSSDTDMNKIGVAIVGAGSVGCALAEELMYSSSSHYYPICFIDKNQEKVGQRINNLRVYNANDDIIETLKSLPVAEVFIAITNIDNKLASEMFDFYSRSGCKVKIYDFPLTDNVSGTGKRIIREFKIEDLLFRDSIAIKSKEADNYYKDKKILVTGGGGSIGSELCRQLAKLSPAELVIFDIYENNAYSIQQELSYRYGEKLRLYVEIGSVRDTVRLDAVFSRYKPDIVFHTAAHKHVPLMEHSACEAIKNNVFGTVNTANAAEKYGVDKFIMISTDKAVNPTNIMGASKRMCEMVIQSRIDSKTSFASVRFGNVLGSNGSVIPLFKSQIAKGGPVTVTDKRITRYFMTIPEASQLVLQAGAMAKRGELFVLDMGKPVKIIELAENMIRLSGLEPYKDIEIIETGLRPGEKLYEELLMKNEKLGKTSNNLIFIEKDTPHTRDEVNEMLCILSRSMEDESTAVMPARVKEAMKKVVCTYYDPDEINNTAKSSTVASE